MNPRVVAIGASAGGLDAFQRLIKILPTETGMAFVLLSHILRGANNAIDHFLYSLAEDRAQGSIGIVLSGEGSDGARGLKILKEQSGGITIAQQPTSAASQSMPIHAIEIDHIDYVLSPEDIAQKLASMAWCDGYMAEAPLKVLWMG